jgi:hypothetical protein
VLPVAVLALAVALLLRQWAPAIVAGLVPVTIDHGLYDRDRIGVRDFQVMTLPGSDHRTTYAELIVSSPASR